MNCCLSFHKSNPNTLSEKNELISWILKNSKKQSGKYYNNNKVLFLIFL